MFGQVLNGGMMVEAVDVFLTTLCGTVAAPDTNLFLSSTASKVVKQEETRALQTPNARAKITSVSHSCL